MFGLHVGLPLTCLVSHEASKVVRSLESGVTDGSEPSCGH